jgi:hypothetical protein
VESRSGNSSLNCASGVLAFVEAFDCHHGDRVFGEPDHVCGTWQRYASQDEFRDFSFRRNDDVDGHLFAGKQILVLRHQIGLSANAGDLRRYVEQRMRNLARHHVDFVVERHRYDHVGVLRAGAGKNVGMRAVANEALGVERVSHVADQVRRDIDNRHVVALGGQSFRDAVSDLAGTADDDLHG